MWIVRKTRDKMVDEFEKAVGERANVEVLGGAIENSQKQAEQQKALEEAVMGSAYEGATPEQRAEATQFYLGDPERAKSLYKKKKKELSESPKNLEGILSDAPFEVMPVVLNSVEYEDGSDIGSYHSVFQAFNTYNATEKAVEEGKAKKEDLKKAQKKARAVAMGRFRKVIENTEMGADTKKFLLMYADDLSKAEDEIGIKISLRHLEKYAVEAQKYLTNKDNENEVVSYVKKVASKEPEKVYNAITNPALFQAG